MGIDIYPLIRHLWRTNRSEIVAKSKLHCHLRNVHSIMLLEAPEKTIRLFVALEGHELQRNMPPIDSGPPLSVALHSHHCEITLLPTRGTIVNWVVDKGDDFKLGSYKFDSAIKGKGEFVSLGDQGLKTIRETFLSRGREQYMEAKVIHTIACSWPASWLVFEGREDKSYDGICYSNEDLTKWNPKNLYQQPTEMEIRNLLQWSELL